jgi:hypothetical protein
MKNGAVGAGAFPDGSLCTVGDVGYFDEDGYLYLTVFAGSLKYAKRVGS